ncbi:Leucine-rich repeat-containing protein [Cynara cardunculus var. scolymus]|uniref:non-specific serine/threonine protein kinase n=1 Tax=Cynara cardunculus var. scolymus TaxID=59895 RepID=A0A103YCX5_CYNCS|nr:Leucine-rich repeat-containing protein [Cynara cardunculus var. scolymus]
MGFLYFFILFLAFLHSLSSSYETTILKQTEFFIHMKSSFSGNSFSDWDITSGKNACNYTGVSCNDEGFVVKINLSAWNLSGVFPENVCSYLPQLKSLHLGRNDIHGDFPFSLTNCSVLEELNMTHTNIAGKLPDLSRMTSLRLLDLSFCSFTGKFPMSFINLTNLEVVNFNENVGFELWSLPDDIFRLRKLRSMILSTCMVSGSIPKSIGNMTSLVDLELSGNFLVGPVPREIGLLRNLQQLELYYNQLDGEIPQEIGNVTELTDIDMSVNKLTGSLPESICRLPKLRVLQFYNNSLTGEIPRVLEESKTLSMLSLYSNYLTGEVPRHLGRSSPLMLFDLSENQLTGELPPEICNGGKLVYLLALDNMFSGVLPESYGKCVSIVRFRLSSNRLEGTIPEGILRLPSVSIIDLSYNSLNGSIAQEIGNSRNLSELFLQNNRISGVIPSEISKLFNLVKIDLSNNLLSGPIPQEIGHLKRLNLLLLQGNRLDSYIPDSLSSLSSLNVLDLSRNHFTGGIPETLCDLLPSSMNFSYNHLSGPIPESFIKGGQLESFLGNPKLCISEYPNLSDQNFAICSEVYNQKKVDYIWVILVSVGFVVIGGILFLRRWLSKERDDLKNEETWSSSYCSYSVKSFHRISFDQNEIVEAMIDKNVVGHGGSGTVYRIDLSNGEVVAVKRLWSQKTKDDGSDDQQIMNKELKTEVETLGNIRHKNIVKLYCYFSSLDCNLLVYEYMPNGNLWDALHRGKCLLDWPTRHQIAVGVAQGLVYLHHDLLPPIIHRDIKSTNILLDRNLQPKVADFGIAKYAYSSKATTKCDVYSFGVVLMELITGKKPVEAEFGENKNIIYWISTKVDTKEGAIEVLDKRLSGYFNDEMIKVLRIAIRCTCKTAALRPNMNEIVQLLIEADPCKFESCKSPNKTKEPVKVNV